MQFSLQSSLLGNCFAFLFLLSIPPDIFFSLSFLPSLILLLPSPFCSPTPSLFWLSFLFCPCHFSSSFLAPIFLFPPSSLFSLPFILFSPFACLHPLLSLLALSLLNSLLSLLFPCSLLSHYFLRHFLLSFRPCPSLLFPFPFSSTLSLCTSFFTSFPLLLSTPVFSALPFSLPIQTRHVFGYRT